MKSLVKVVAVAAVLSLCLSSATGEMFVKKWLNNRDAASTSANSGVSAHERWCKDKSNDANSFFDWDQGDLDDLVAELLKPPPAGETALEVRLGVSACYGGSDTTSLTQVGTIKLDVDWDVFTQPAVPPGQTVIAAPHSLQLRPGSPAVDAGVVMPGINGDFTGRAPDLGCYELGRPVPHYGPRSE